VDREMESITMKYLGDRSSIDLLFSATYMHELSGGASAGDGEAPRYIEGGEDMLKVMSTVMSSRGNEVRLLQMLPLGNKGDAMDALAMTTVLEIRETPRHGLRAGVEIRAIFSWRELEYGGGAGAAP
jgi:hypothetical protein